MSIKVLALMPSGRAVAFSSLRAASRSLSGTGSDGLRNTITDRVLTGGGYVGNVWVQSTNYPQNPLDEIRV